MEVFLKKPDQILENKSGEGKQFRWGGGIKGLGYTISTAAYSGREASLPDSWVGDTEGKSVHKSSPAGQLTRPQPFYSSWGKRQESRSSALGRGSPILDSHPHHLPCVSLENKPPQHLGAHYVRGQPCVSAEKPPKKKTLIEASK